MTYFQHLDFSKCHFSHFVIFLGFEKSLNGYKLSTLAMLAFHHHAITSLSYDFYHLVFIHLVSRVKIRLNFISIFSSFFIVSFLAEHNRFLSNFKDLECLFYIFFCIRIYLHHMDSYLPYVPYRMFLRKIIRYISISTSIVNSIFNLKNKDRLIDHDSYICANNNAK